MVTPQIFIPVIAALLRGKDAPRRFLVWNET
jgi:hypothetical protein